MSTPIEQIKDRLTIEEVVGQYVELKPAGKNLRGLSPFNPEKTPSFYVSPDRGVYYCFSSGKGGDMFTFIQEMEGGDFKDALRTLAERAGIELVPENKEEREGRERLLELLNEVTSWYQRGLLERADALEYLAGRGVKESTIHEWRLGFVPNQWRLVHDHFLAQGYSVEELASVGLVKQGPKGGWYDRFRGRIMFPMNDPSGRPVAFSGRVFEYDRDKEVPAKYLNSPETEFFDKSKLLYGLDRAKSAIRKFTFAILVEGQMDLIMSHQAGFRNTVAVSGTGLTASHVNQLKRLSDNVVMAFDGDAAGLRSMVRGAALALGEGMEVKIAELPDGGDPAEVIADNPEMWRAAIRESRHVVDYYLNHLKQTAKDERAFTRAVRTNVLPLIVHIPSPVERAANAERVAQVLSIPQQAVLDELAAVAADVAQAKATPVSAPGVTTPVLEQLTRSQSVLKAVCGILRYLKANDESLYQSQKTTIVEFIPEEKLEELLDEYASDEALLFQVELVAAEPEQFQSYQTTVLEEARDVWARDELRQASWELSQAEQAGDDERVLELMQHLQTLAKKVHQ